MAHVSTINQTARLVVSRPKGGGIEVRTLSPDRSQPFGGQLVGYTRSDLIGWVAAWRLDGYSETADVADAETAELFVRDKLRMPARPTAPCPWCAFDPESPYCCGGDHPDRRALAQAVQRAPEIWMQGGSR